MSVNAWKCQLVSGLRFTQCLKLLKFRLVTINQTILLTEMCTSEDKAVQIGEVPLYMHHTVTCIVMTYHALDVAMEALHRFVSVDHTPGSESVTFDYCSINPPCVYNAETGDEERCVQ